MSFFGRSEYVLDYSIYPRELISKAISDYSRYCHFSCLEDNHSRVTLSLDFPDSYKSNRIEITCEFFNYLLGLSVKQRSETM